MVVVEAPAEIALELIVAEVLGVVVSFEEPAAIIIVDEGIRVVVADPNVVADRRDRPDSGCLAIGVREVVYLAVPRVEHCDGGTHDRGPDS